MKSANITALPGMGDMGVAPQRTVAKQDDENKPVDFKMLMHRSIADGRQGANADRTNAASNLGAVQDRKASSSFESPRQDRKIINNTDNGRPLTDDMKDNVQATFGEIEDAVKKSVADELGISEDELDEAMEVLGLSYIDLFDPANMQMLLGQIGEAMPGLSADVLALDPEMLIGQMEAAAAPVLEAAQLAPEELDYLLTEFVPLEEPAVAESFTDILEQAGIPAYMTEAGRTQQSEEQLPAGFTPIRSERDVRSDVTVIRVVDEEPQMEDTAAVQPDEGKAGAAVETNMANTANTAAPATESVSTTVTQTAETEDMTQTTSVTVEVTESFTEGQGFTGEQQNTGESGLGDNNPAADFNPNDILTAVHQQAANVQQNFAEAAAQAQAVSEAAMPYTSVDAADVIDQIVTSAQATITEEITRMELELNPQTLGRMIMQVQSDSDGVVTAKLIAQNEAVREALETQMNLLRENMNNRGIRVEAVEVSVGTHEFEQALEEGQQQAGQYEDEQREQQAAQGRRMRNLNAADIDEMQGMLTEEEELTARIMRDEGNTLNYQA